MAISPTLKSKLEAQNDFYGTNAENLQCFEVFTTQKIKPLSKVRDFLMKTVMATILHKQLANKKANKRGPGENEKALRFLNNTGEFEKLSINHKTVLTDSIGIFNSKIEDLQKIFELYAKEYKNSIDIAVKRSILTFDEGQYYKNLLLKRKEDFLKECSRLTLLSSEIFSKYENWKKIIN